MSGGDVVIPLQVLRARQADAMSAKERGKVRRLLGEFETVRNDCPTAHRLTTCAEVRVTSGAPLTPDELRAVRTMLLEFEAIKHGCPTARRLLNC